jgi:Flp pilus assembly protein TadG
MELAGKTGDGKIGGRSGQSLIEFTLMAAALLVLVFGIIDIGRALSQRQILINLSREGANLASRGTSVTNTVDALVVSANPLNIANDGRIILTVIQRQQDLTLKVVDQYARGGLSDRSRVAPLGLITPSATIKIPNNVIPQPDQLLTVAEVFHTYTAITPLGRFVAVAIPSPQYDAAYF